MNHTTRFLSLAVGLAASGWFAPPAALAAEPCCEIVSIAENGRVTARDRSSRKSFQFQVNDKALLRSLRVGQAMHADFTSMKVSVQPDGGEPCCLIVSAPSATPGAGAIPGVKVPQVHAGDPCCTITSIAGSVVSARETATGKTFQFQANNPALLKSLRVGQRIHADFTTLKVSVQPDGGEPCCAIVSAPGATPGAGALSGVRVPQVKAGEPCCDITSIAGSVVSARETATGRTFQFQANNPALLKSLRVGQQIHADFTSMKVSVQPDGGAPCCEIVAAPGATPGAGAIPSVKVPQVAGATPCCNIVANAAMKGRMGRLVVAYPQGAKVDSSRVQVFRAGEAKPLAGGHGAQAYDLLPGTYAVVISGKRVEGVTVQSGHDTKVKVGVLRVSAGSGTKVDVLDGATKARIAGGHGNMDIGLPIGAAMVQVAGQSEAVTIQDGKITDF